MRKSLTTPNFPLNRSRKGEESVEALEAWPQWAEQLEKGDMKSHFLEAQGFNWNSVLIDVCITSTIVYHVAPCSTM